MIKVDRCVQQRAGRRDLDEICSAPGDDRFDPVKDGFQIGASDIAAVDHAER